MESKNTQTELQLSYQDLVTIDEKILRHAFDYLLQKNLNFLVADELFPLVYEEGICTKEIFDMRIYSLIGKNMLQADIDEKTAVLRIKITALGIAFLEEQDTLAEQEKNKTWHEKMVEWAEMAGVWKVKIGVGLTAILAVAIVAFDLPMTQFLEKVPLLSSVVNVDFLSDLEDIQSDDPDSISLRRALASNVSLKNITRIQKVRTVNANQKNERAFVLSTQEGKRFLARVDISSENQRTKIFALDTQNKNPQLLFATTLKNSPLPEPIKRISY